MPPGEVVSDSLERLRSRAITQSHPDFPERLRALADPPRVVYVRGRIPAGVDAIAIVGSRAASPYGEHQAYLLASDLARLGFMIVSGLARGIDAAAHRGALEAGGPTLAVMPGGLDAITPRHHRELAERVASQGALLTEIPSGEPRPGMFLRRNRLIAALGSATVVVEAAERSGALSTAAVARGLGRPLLAVPGDLDRPTSRGCHGLIRSGARVCVGVEDIVAAIGVPGEHRPQDHADRRGAKLPNPPSLATPAARLLSVLGPEAQPLEVLAARSGIGLEQTVALLLELEWSGLARALPGQRWARGEGRKG